MAEKQSYEKLEQRILELEKKESQYSQTWNSLKLNEACLEALLKLSLKTDESKKVLVDFALEQAIFLTNSTIGYLAFLNEDETILSMYSWSKQAMKNCEIFDKPIDYPIISTGFWGEAVRQRKPVVTNDYTRPNPLKKGLPKGHIPLDRHMNVPIFDKDKIVAVAGVGNKQEPYDEFDVRQLTLLIQGMWTILKRRASEAALKKNEQELRSIFRAAPTGIGMVCDRIIQKVNNRVCEMTGYSQNELIGQNARFLYPTDEEFEYVGKEKYRQISDKGTGTVETKFQCKNGKIMDVLMSSTPIDLNDLLKGVTFTALDISYLKKKELELSESEKKYRSMMEAMEEATYICSSKYLVEYMNPAMIKRTGRDALGELCHKVIHGLDKKCPWCVFEKVIKDEPINHEIVSPKDDRTYHISNSPIFHTDGSASKLTILRDITDFKKMENQLQQSQKMESIGTLAGGIAHDFNNILFPVFGYLEMAMEDVPEDSPVRDHLEEVLSGAQRARDLVQQILTFSRQSDHELKPLKTQIVVREALKLLRSSIPSTIEINQNIDRGCGLVMADPTNIHQIVMNLCTNAFHAMEESGGKLSITLKEVKLTIEDLKDPAMDPGPHICLMVADNGQGMKQNIIDRIFDPYFTTKEMGKGTGLGLAVIHGIVKDYGGYISVYSEPGKGSEFKIYLPVIQSSKAEGKIETNLPLQRGTERVLLVDDQDLVLQMERTILERLGYQVTVQTNSIDALELFRAKSDDFDLVITDMTMPDMTGDKLACELIKIRSDIPVILCTGFSETMSEEKAAYLGIKGFLLKPILTKDLSQKIREVLDESPGLL